MNANEMIKKLSEFYGRTPTPEFTRQFMGAMSLYSPDILQRVYQHTTYHDERMQSLSMLINFANHFKEDDERVEHHKQRQTEARPVQGKDAYSKTVFFLINSAMSGKLTRRQFLSGMSDLKLEVGDLANFYEQRGLNLDKPCGHGITIV